MTKEELKTTVKNSIDHCIYYAGILDNPHLSKRDVEEVAKPIATLAILHGFSWDFYNLRVDYLVLVAYLKSLALVVRIEGSYIEEMHELIDAQYKEIYAKIRDDDTLTGFDLIIVIEDLLMEAK